MIVSPGKKSLRRLRADHSSYSPDHIVGDLVEIEDEVSIPTTNTRLFRQGTQNPSGGGRGEGIEARSNTMTATATLQDNVAGLNSRNAAWVKAPMATFDTDGPLNQAQSGSTSRSLPKATAGTGSNTIPLWILTRSTVETEELWDGASLQSTTIDSFVSQVTTMASRTDLEKPKLTMTGPSCTKMTISPGNEIKWKKAKKELAKKIKQAGKQNLEEFKILVEPVFQGAVLGELAKEGDDESDFEFEF